MIIFSIITIIVNIIIVCSIIIIIDIIILIIILPVAIASFANFLPEIAELLGNQPKYAGSFKVGIFGYSRVKLYQIKRFNV